MGYGQSLLTKHRTQTHWELPISWLAASPNAILLYLGDKVITWHILVVDRDAVVQNDFTTSWMLGR